MSGFIPLNKLSKKAHRSLMQKNRKFWSRNPATRCPAKPSAYNRSKARSETHRHISSEL